MLDHIVDPWEVGHHNQLELQVYKLDWSDRHILAYKWNLEYLHLYIHTQRFVDYFQMELIQKVWLRS